MLTYPQFEKAVLLSLHDSMTQETYEVAIANRMSIIELIIMDEYDRDGMNRPTPEQVAQQIRSEFGID